MSLHALKGGFLAELNGGDFGHGFRGAAFNKVAGVAIAGAKPGGFGTQLTLAALAGGFISQATGGKFGNGAVSAAIQFAYNEKQRNLRRSRNYDVGYRFVKRLREDLYGKRFESELDAWTAFAGPAGRMTETTGMEFGANLIQARDGFYIVDITQGLETGVAIPNYQGIQRWGAFICIRTRRIQAKDFPARRNLIGL